MPDENEVAQESELAPEPVAEKPQEPEPVAEKPALPPGHVEHRSFGR